MRAGLELGGVEELIEEIPNDVVLGMRVRVPRCTARGGAVRDTECHELANAVFDIQPHAAKCLHQGFNVEGFLRAGAEEAKNRRTQR